jgi:tetratricopeptide (TPR) repeat protein
VTNPSPKQTQLLQQAAALHQAGRLNEAAAKYRKLLNELPEQVFALNNLAVIAIQQNEYTQAVNLINQSLKITPAQPRALNNRGIALHKLQRHPEALDSFATALQQQPDFAEASFNQGNVLMDMQRLEQALVCFDRAIALNPGYIKAHYNRSDALKALQRYAEALDSYGSVIALQPDFAEAWSNRAEVLRLLGRAAEAITSHDRAIALNPTAAGAYFSRGLTLHSLQRLDEALADHDRAIALNLQDAQLYCSRGVILSQLLRLPQAIKSLQQAVVLKADYAEAWFNQGNVHNEAHNLEAALASFDRAVAIRPDYAEAWVNRGNVFKDMGSQQQALHSYQQALLRNPDSAEFLTNCGLVLQDMLRLDEALAYFDQAIALNPGYAEAGWNKALLKLLSGDYAQGFQLYENRWRIQPFLQQARQYPQPLWTGQNAVAGKKLLIYPEQGLGDFIQFCRYIPMLAQLGVEILLEAPQPLYGLLGSLHAGFKLLKAGHTVTDFDYHCPLLTLPLAFKTELPTIPADIPYLTADSQRQQYWRQQLGPKSRPRVGLVCSGGRLHKRDHQRSIPLREFVDLLALPVEFHSLQQELRDEDQAWLSTNPQLSLHQHTLTDFADTAALIVELDLVISVDTSVAHLAGALGKPLWMLLPHAPDFRWLLNRTDSPWYPTATLFRQAQPDDWVGVLREVIATLSCARPCVRLRVAHGSDHLSESHALHKPRYL